MMAMDMPPDLRAGLISSLSREVNAGLFGGTPSDVLL